MASDSNIVIGPLLIAFTIFQSFSSELRQFRDERMTSMKEPEKWKLKDVRAVFSDIDGTLLDSEEDCPVMNLKAIQEIVEPGHFNGFCQRRSTGSIRNLFAGLDEHNFNAIAFNGSEVTLRGEVISRTKLDSVTASQIVRTVSEINIHIHAYVDGDWSFRN